MKKSVPIVFVVTALGLIAGFFFWHAKSVVVADRAQDRFSSWGYSVERYRFHRGTRLEIWNSRGLNLTYDEPEMTVTKVSEQRWLSNQRAIYLDLNLSIKHDSLLTDVPAKILFDYKRGELYLTCSDPLWREGDWGIYRGNTTWRTEAEFHSVLEAIEK
jgi:hypothetical protein